MSDPDAMPDPIDQAYVEAEAVLNDEVARRARRSRVLAAVGRQGAPDVAPPAARPPIWRRGGWLAAASVAGLALVVALQIYRPTASPATNQTPTPPASPAPATPAPTSPASAEVPAPVSKAAPRAERPQAEPRPVVLAPSPPPPPPSDAAPRAFPNQESGPPSAAPAAGIAANEQAAPVQSANQAQPSSGQAGDRAGVSEIVVTSEKRQSRRPVVAGAVSAFTGRIQQVFDAGARLRSAADAGHTADVQALLERGASVDSPDADGNTALMKSIQADHPAAAAILLRHGASLDRQNHAGESARDMARDQDDTALNQALGLSP